MSRFNITFPDDTNEIITRIRATIGREVTFYINTSGNPCSICTLDPVTNLSVDPFCSGCDGNYWRVTTSAWPCTAHVKWRSANQPLWQMGGIIDEGDCKITIAYSGPALENVTNSKYVIVDDRDMYIKNFSLKGVQPLNRIAITLLEDSSEV